MAFNKSEAYTGPTLDYDEVPVGVLFKFYYPKQGAVPALLSVGTFLKAANGDFTEAYNATPWRSMHTTDAPRTRRVALVNS